MLVDSNRVVRSNLASCGGKERRRQSEISVQLARHGWIVDQMDSQTNVVHQFG